MQPMMAMHWDNRVLVQHRSKLAMTEVRASLLQPCTHAAYATATRARCLCRNLWHCTSAICSMVIFRRVCTLMSSCCLFNIVWTTAATPCSTERQYSAPDARKRLLCCAGSERVHFVSVNLPGICFGQASARPQGSLFRPHHGLLLPGASHRTSPWGLPDPHHGVLCFAWCCGREPSVCHLCAGRKLISSSTAAGGLFIFHSTVEKIVSHCPSTLLPH